MLANFSLPRIFALVGGMIFMLAATGLGYFGHRASIRELVELTEENNVALATVLSNVFEQQRESGDHDGFTDIGQIVRRVTRHTRVLKVKIFDRTGLTVYSSDPSQIGKAEGENPNYLAALAGHITSDLSYAGQFHAFEGVVADRTLVSSYIPVRGGDSFGQPAVLEVYADITALEDKVRRGSLVTAAAIGAAFATIYLLLLYTVSVGSKLIARKHAETLELAAAAARAEEASKGQSEFLVNMSHELRTPLNAILGFSDVIQKEIYGPASPPIYREYAGDIHAAGSHLLGIINDILDLMKTSAGKMKVHLAETDLGGLVEQTGMLMRQSAAAAGVRLDCVAGPLVPVVWADERKLKQVLINLLDNAIKFTPEGGVVTLEVRQDRQDRIVEIVVTDTGIGIAAADIPTCLAPFGQVDVSLARNNQGTGLGLPLSKQFVGLMGGTLAIESAVGKGTRVVVRLPLRSVPWENSRLAA